MSTGHTPAPPNPTGLGTVLSEPGPGMTARPGPTLLGHPIGLFVLFGVEMWERFSYYGMRGLLVLYLIAVVSVKELKPGVYSNDLEITRIAETEKPDPSDSTKKITEAADGASRVQQLTITVGQSAQPPAGGKVTTPGDLGLTIERVKKIQIDDPKHPGEKVDSYVPAGVGADDPILVSGAPGDKSFKNDQFAFRITNPGDKVVKIRVGIKRTEEEPRPFFKVNDSPVPVVADIKPEKDLKPGDERFVASIDTNPVSSGRYWNKADASTLYGWYTGLAYLFPILGGLIADKLIGTHRSMLVGGLLIALGHIVLGISGIGDLAQNAMGMSVFITGLALIVLGTGHFKPSVSVMVGQLYGPGDPRRDGAFTIFYMGINLGAFFCAFVCGTLGEKVGWHWGFASAAVGMLLGLAMYLFLKPVYLKGIGEPASTPPARATGAGYLFLIGSCVVSALFGAAYHAGLMGAIQRGVDDLAANPVLAWSVIAALLAGILAWSGWFIAMNRPEDRGPVVTIFVFMLFNAFFWAAFEQAGSSINVFTEENTNRMLGGFEVPATWFQSINAGLIFILAPLFAMIWTALGKRRMNPSQPVKIALGLIFLGVGYLFMVMAGRSAIGGTAKAGMWLVFMTYFWHTVGELCLSPTGLAYVTKAAPVKFVSLLMGIWFVSSFIANLGGGLIAAQVENIEKGKTHLWWHFGGQADFFFLFVVTSFGAAIVMFLCTPVMKMLMRHPDD